MWRKDIYKCYKSSIYIVHWFTWKYFFCFCGDVFVFIFVFFGTSDQIHDLTLDRQVLVLLSYISSMKIFFHSKQGQWSFRIWPALPAILCVVTGEDWCLETGSALRKPHRYYIACSTVSPTVSKGVHMVLVTLREPGGDRKDKFSMGWRILQGSQLWHRCCTLL